MLITLNDTKELIYKTETLTDLENKLMVLGQGEGGEDRLGVWD